MTTKPEAPAAERNKDVILDVIRPELRHCESVLEIGSGTGQHAVHFAAAMPWLVWQTSDRPDHHPGIIAWLQDAGLTNTRKPILLDVATSRLPADRYDAVFSANTAHIMHFEAVSSMFSVVGAVLKEGGKFFLYGPFNLGGAFTSDSNRRFDESLKSRDPGMGIRNLEDLDKLGSDNGLERAQLFAMPANNMLAVWNRRDSGETGGGT